ncbi:MAG: TIGR04133 family radical SAM/SPASM protein [Bacteroidales bacterium]|jgi:radical SAM enzyme (rSAM/lipoprotein system)|nr:TIGR04133 family radical SAM/SPASM protein [Bacteroidales bacterium]
MLKQFFFRKFKENETQLHELNYLFWECTAKCNLNCLHCGSDCTKDSLHGDMPLADFLEAIDTIENPAPNFTVVITGGEPLLRKDLEICGREIRKRNMRWGIVTNGLLYDKARHVSLLNAGLGALTISLDGLSETHNWLRNSKKSFERATQAITLAASSHRLNFDVVTCVNQRNITELSKIREFIIEKGVKAWRLFTIFPIGRAAGNTEMFLTDIQFQTLMEFIYESRKHAEIDVKFSCEGYVGKYEWKVRDSGFFCRAGINIGSILIDGSIAACPNIDRSLTQGNICSNSFWDVWNTKYEVFRKRGWTKTGKCQTCKEYKNCLGNGLHFWHGNRSEPIVCHNEKLL